MILKTIISRSTNQLQLPLTLTTFGIFIFGILAQAQGFQNDSLQKKGTEPFSLLDQKKPCDSIYKGKWDTLYIRIKHDTVFRNPNDSILLQLLSDTHPDFAIPLKSKVISKYGPRGRRLHTGTDVKCRLGDTIVSAFDGVVRMAKTYSGYGYTVVVRHYNGLETVYAHLSKIKVKVNQTVYAGDLIGLGGRTGRATTEHLHFEVRYLTEHFNPELLFDFENGTLRKNEFALKPGHL